MQLSTALAEIQLQVYNFNIPMVYHLVVSMRKPAVLAEVQV